MGCESKKSDSESQSLDGKLVVLETVIPTKSEKGLIVINVRFGHLSHKLAEPSFHHPDVET